MAYTLSGIRNRVINDKLDDENYETEVVDRFINDVQRTIFNTYELPFMEKTFIGTLPEGEYIFTFPTDYQLVQSLILTSPTTNIHDLTDRYIPFRDFNTSYPQPDNNAAGTPSVWTVHGNKLYVNAPTDQAYQLTMYYIKTPDELTDAADVPEVPSEFEEILVLGAYYRVLQRNEDYDLAAAVKAEYNEQLDLVVQRLGKRQTGTPNRMAQPFRMGGRARRRS